MVLSRFEVFTNRSLTLDSNGLVTKCRYRGPFAGQLSSRREGAVVGKPATGSGAPLALLNTVCLWDRGWGLGPGSGTQAPLHVSCLRDFGSQVKSPPFTLLPFADMRGSDVQPGFAWKSLTPSFASCPCWLSACGQCLAIRSKC